MRVGGQKTREDQIEATFYLSAQGREEPFDLAHEYCSRGDWKTYKALVEAGTGARDPRAVHEMAQWYLHGCAELGVDADPVRAVMLLKEAAKHDGRTAYDLAVCHETGIGTRVSLKTAYRMYVRAGALGSLRARQDVCRCLKYGIGIDRNPRTASVLLRMMRVLNAEMPPREPRGFLATPFRQRVGATPNLLRRP